MSNVICTSLGIWGYALYDVWSIISTVGLEGEGGDYNELLYNRRDIYWSVIGDCIIIKWCYSSFMCSRYSVMDC